MSTREELLAHLWAEVINLQLRLEGWAQVIAYAKQRPDDPLADSGPALERLLALGADAGDICLLMRNTANEAVFSTLYAIGDPGVDGNDVFMLHEDLLSAIPVAWRGVQAPRPDRNDQQATDGPAVITCCYAIREESVARHAAVSRER